ncbi:MAG: type II secretion system F family protein [Nanoarchaeota archaeon]|nr:type II secretion system F family protein [Nanoarchaeota archaeon]
MFEDLKNNILQEKKIIMDMRSIRISMLTDHEQYKFYISSLTSLAHQLRLLNRATPELLREWSPVSKLRKKYEEEREEKSKAPKVIKKIKTAIKKIEPSKTVKIAADPKASKKNYIVLNKKDKADFLKSLKFSEKIFKSFEKKTIKKKKKVIGTSSFARTSNKFFRGFSEGIVPKFSELTKDLKKGNVPFLTSTYLSMAILAGIIAFSLGFVGTAGLVIYNFSNWVYGWIPFALLGLVWMGFYFYPASEASSGDKRISQELPFATIHMAAIAGSNIEPTKIFKIISNSKEYSYIGTEMKKVTAQVELYGYDLVTSLKNVAARTSNKKLAELFTGLATNISTGGALKNFLEKKSETFLLDYKLEREKYSDLAGTFMDVYISILIAAPLVLMMMFIVMNVAGLGSSGLSLNALLALSIGGITLTNIIFLFILNAKQPSV